MIIRGGLVFNLRYMLKIIPILSLCFISFKTHAFTDDQLELIDKTHEIVMVAVPAYAWGTTYDDMEGMRQFIIHFIFANTSVELIKKVVPEKRPDYQAGDAKDSFPSGHTVAAMSGATFIHRRYGFKKSIPFYLLGSYVGWSRMALDRHHLQDVVASTAIALASAYLFVTPKKSNKEFAFNDIALGAMYNPYNNGINISFSKSF